MSKPVVRRANSARTGIVRWEDKRPEVRKSEIPVKYMAELLDRLRKAEFRQTYEDLEREKHKTGEWACFINPEGQTLYWDDTDRSRVSDVRPHGFKAYHFKRYKWDAQRQEYVLEEREEKVEKAPEAVIHSAPVYDEEILQIHRRLKETEALRETEQSRLIEQKRKELEDKRAQRHVQVGALPVEGEDKQSRHKRKGTPHVKKSAAERSNLQEGAGLKVALSFGDSLSNTQPAAATTSKRKEVSVGEAAPNPSKKRVLGATKKGVRKQSSRPEVEIAAEAGDVAVANRNFRAATDPTGGSSTGWVGAAAAAVLAGAVSNAYQGCEQDNGQETEPPTQTAGLKHPHRATFAKSKRRRRSSDGLKFSPSPVKKTDQDRERGDDGQAANGDLGQGLQDMANGELVQGVDTSIQAKEALAREVVEGADSWEIAEEESWEMGQKDSREVVEGVDMVCVVGTGRQVGSEEKHGDTSNQPEKTEARESETDVVSSVVSSGAAPVNGYDSPQSLIAPPLALAKHSSNPDPIERDLQPISPIVSQPKTSATPPSLANAASPLSAAKSADFLNISVQSDGSAVSPAHVNMHELARDVSPAHVNITMPASSARPGQPVVEEGLQLDDLEGRERAASSLAAVTLHASPLPTGLTSPKPLTSLDWTNVSISPSSYTPTTVLFMPKPTLDLVIAINLLFALWLLSLIAVGIEGSRGTVLAKGSAVTVLVITTVVLLLCFFIWTRLRGSERKPCWLFLFSLFFLFPGYVYYRATISPTLFSASQRLPGPGFPSPVASPIGAPPPFRSPEARDVPTVSRAPTSPQEQRNEDLELGFRNKILASVTSHSEILQAQQAVVKQNSGSSDPAASVTICNTGSDAQPEGVIEHKDFLNPGES
eukprot:g17003.t1